MNFWKMQVINDMRKGVRAVLQIQKYFECKRCGNCCREIPVELTDEDVAHICKHLGIKKFEEFESKYMDEKAIGNYLKTPCPFLDEKANTCNIYEHRPIVCRFYPFVERELLWQIHWCPMGSDIIQKILNTFPTLLENSRAEKPHVEAELQSIGKVIDDMRPRISEEEIKTLTINVPVLLEFLKRLEEDQIRPEISEAIR